MRLHITDIHPTQPHTPTAPIHLYHPPDPIHHYTSLPKHASTSYHRYAASPAPLPQATTHHLSPYYPRGYLQMDPACPSQGASPQTEYAPTTPRLKSDPYNGSQPGSVDSNAPVHPYLSPGPSHGQPPPPIFEAEVAPSNAPPLAQEQVSIRETSPMQGSPGAQFTVKCEVTFPNTSASPSPYPNEEPLRRDRAVRIVFGQYPLPTTVTVLPDPLLAGQLVHLKVQVPGWLSVATSADGNQVPVTIQVLLGEQVVASVGLGDYAYLSFSSGSRIPSYSGYGNSSDYHNPLKRAGESLESHRPSPTSFEHRRMLSNNFQYESASPEMSGHAPLPQRCYGAPVMHADNYSQPQESGAAGGEPSTSWPMPGQPYLQRSSHFVGAVPIAPCPTSGGLKANLELVGDLDNMAKEWSTDEWNNRRRLVQFWWKQEGTTITCAFKPLAQDNWSANTQSIIISCIFREDDNQCYVTSVDAIYLLEALVGNRFTVEEKNRIRRNLEGFRPTTVSKNKPGSEDLFRVIMSFPNPKPRNIEKDVKVFPWSIFGQALKKIISKYASQAVLPESMTNWKQAATLPGSISTGLPAQLLPYAPTYPVQPTLLQPPDMPSHMHSYESASTDSILSLSTVKSTDFAAFSPVSGMYEQHHGDTPSHLSHQPYSHGDFSNYRPGSIPRPKALHHQQYSQHFDQEQAQGQGHGDYVNISPTHMSSYSGTTSYYPGMGGVQSPGGGGDGGAGEYGANVPPSSVPHHPHGHPDQSQLPHLHQTSERPPTSNDLRVTYPPRQ